VEKIENLTIPKYNNILKNPYSKNRNQPTQLPIIEIDLSSFKANLIGLNKLEIIELLDKPAFKRTEYPASIWQYRSTHCFVDIFFYSVKKQMLVDHVETRGNSLQKVSEKICFASLIDARYTTQKQNSIVR
jgi:hypothetical protein